MKKFFLILLGTFLAFYLVSCESENANNETKMEKDKSFTVDSEFTYVYSEQFVLRKEFTQVYSVNKNLVKTIVRVDTLPASHLMIKDTLSYEKNDEVRDTIIYHEKEYQTYIKVSKAQ